MAAWVSGVSCTTLAAQLACDTSRVCWWHPACFSCHNMMVLKRADGPQLWACDFKFMHSRLHASRALNFKIRQCLGLYHTNDDSISESSCKQPHPGLAADGKFLCSGRCCCGKLLGYNIGRWRLWPGPRVCSWLSCVLRQPCSTSADSLVTTLRHQ